MTIKQRADALRKMLADEYGIMSDEELMEEMEKLEPIPIGVFTFKRKHEVKETEKTSKSIIVRGGVIVSGNVAETDAPAS